MMSAAASGRRVTRRAVLGAGIAAAGFAAAPAWAHSIPADAPRRLRFLHRHTDETVDVVYWNNGWYLPDALDEVNHILRDFRTGEVRKIDIKLLDMLSRMHAWLGAKHPYHVFSAYRTPETNAKLREAGTAAAINSLHMAGMAIDIRLPHRKLHVLRRAAMSQHGGGVGYYPSRGFVHIDVGRVRYWNA